MSGIEVVIEPLIEGGGCIAGLALLYYVEVWRPARKAARDQASAQTSRPVPSAAPDPDPSSASTPEDGP